MGQETRQDLGQDLESWQDPDLRPDPGGDLAPGPERWQGSEPLQDPEGGAAPTSWGERGEREGDAASAGEGEPPTALVAAAAGEIGEAAALAQAAWDYVAAARAQNTWRAYQADWRHFENWCQLRSLCPLPATPETLVLYLVALARTHKTSTLQRRLTAIAQAHKAKELEPPTKAAAVVSVWSGIKRVHGTAQQGKAPTLIDDIRAMAAAADASTLLGRRDRALLLVGFAGGFRRSELVGLNVEDVASRGAGMVLTLRRSKTDQEGAGRPVGIPLGSREETCPVRALAAWTEAAAITAGPLFRPVTRHGKVLPERLSDKAVALVVKRLAKAAGRDPALFAGHSLRAGLATAAAAGGASERKIMEQTGHRSEKMVRRYIRDADIFQGNAAAAAGL